MSTHPSGGVVRLARAAYLAAVILGLAVAGHVLGGGSWPSWGALSGVLILAGGLSAVLTRARLRAPRLAATLAGGQLAVHEVLSWTTGHGSMGHDHAAMALDPAEGMPSGWLTTWLGADLRMLAGHAVATVLAAAVIAHGERVLWLAWEAVRPRVTLWRTPVVLPRVRHWCAAVLLPPRTAALALTADPRGPPAMSAA
ncbi:MAG TPA: hypothetical protein PLL54_06590 [Dermatophilaceae bacterium]|nr:hypothetical protein [Dermatophilaceae bacterium]